MRACFPCGEVKVMVSSGLRETRVWVHTGEDQFGLFFGVRTCWESGANLGDPNYVD